ncbi:glyoxalase [Natronoglycomyces albus]|uniref:Glyoxalase n=2 Tax=Natronoglycomyces albus TaxID=2811108 RepID=A0A895XN02_9ACTN|nr:glyoxalase [Natronoglycomyces albus]
MYFGIHHIQLGFPVGEEAKLAPFYVDILGLTELAKPPALATRGGKWFRGPTGGNIEFHLGAIPGFQAPPKVHPGIVWGDIESLTALADRLQSANYPVTWDGELENHPMYRNDGSAADQKTVSAGYVRFYTRCPFGNRLEFMALAQEPKR